MNQQHEERIFVPKDLVLAPGETSFGRKERPRTDDKSSPHEVLGTSKAAIPGRRREHGAKFAARRTPRNRLIASLQRAHGGPESVQPSKTASPELPGTVPAAIVGQGLTSDDATTAIRFTVEIPPESPTPTLEPERPCQNRTRSTPSPTHVGSVLTRNQELPLVTGLAEPPDVEATKITPRRTRNFDSAAFDVAIYRQSGAMNAPHGMSFPSHRQQKPLSSSQDGRVYIHANPAIHLSHNRSEGWHKQKAHEIEARGRRKAWFGKVFERQRWLRAQEVARKRQVNGNASARRHVTPQPWTYRRPLDFGDVDESHLPEDVLGDPNWRKACAWHREVRHMKTLRRRLALKSAQETQQFFRNVIGGIRPGPRRGFFLDDHP
ncbi:hypothetical protein HRG_004209 [Hirsutella rhossiliensis]|uniref:Uncharacterized protein n=1 Tax=Hirsutella rhossiliensis TaxID=111463 RepID=A0A9P8SID6_9HYPO|nr:uncharacterized protein HRG_04209 [Hirsutella rhossiliensis]KAH0963781.1 hypothetical protein HRG_04209 [Hirsutella rhossiliensis]